MERRRLLALDGGGVRGLSSLYILKDLMLKVQFLKKLQQEPRPCDYFDMIAGTSTGGIIAIMLGRLQMTVSQCIREYLRLGEIVFGEQNGYHKHDRYDARKLEKVIAEVVKERLGDAEAPLLDPDCTKTFVVTLDTKAMAGSPVLLRTYATASAQVDCTIIEAARATSAAPTFFEPKQIGAQTYVDGGMGRNNPSSVLFDEMRSYCRIAGDGSVLPEVFLSIGTGQMDLVQLDRAGMLSWWSDRTGLSYAGTVRDLLTDCQNTHLEMLTKFQDLDLRKRYFRWEVLKGLEEVILDEYKKNGDIESATNAYIRNNLSVEREPENCAMLLLAVGSRGVVPPQQTLPSAATRREPPSSRDGSTYNAGRDINNVGNIGGNAYFGR